MILRAVSAVWRSAWVPRLLTAVALVLGLPMALRMPPWVDVTLYDNAAQALLHGEIHYQDVFDTNPPGFVWALTAVRALFGTSYEALWVVDLAVVLGVVLLIDRLAKWGGATPAVRWWVFAGVAFFYPFVTEGVHGQRDVWMSLPAMAAIALRVRRTRLPDANCGWGFRPGLLEGLVWGVAVWVKPHVMFVAAGAWLLTARRVAGGRGWRGVAFDFLGNLVGGVLVGLAGLVLLWYTGSLPGFIEVFTVWNTDYVGLVGRELDTRYDQQLHWFPPWSLFLIPTIPLAVLSVLDGVWPTRSTAGVIGRWLPRRLYDAGADDGVRFARAVLGGCYLLWAYQALYFQRGFQYVHVTETFLMLGLWAAHRWALPALVLGWFALTSTAWVVADASPEFREALCEVAYCDHERDHYLVRHPLSDPGRMEWWTTCLRTDLGPKEKGRLRDGIKYVRNHEASIGWEEIEEVSEFLRHIEQPVRDGELICWHDSPHALYLVAGPNRTRVKPGIRFMHVFTVLVMGEEAEKRMLHEVGTALPNCRFAVTDLCITTLGHDPGTEAWRVISQPGVDDDLLPPGLAPGWREQFPFNRRAIFRTKGGRGRYVVHAANEPAAWYFDARNPWPRFGPGMNSVLRFLREP